MAEPLTVLDIIQAYLREHGYDGLYNPDVDEGCSCRLDDLVPCNEEAVLDCVPGYLCPCPPECGCHDWHIGPKGEK